VLTNDTDMADGWNMPEVAAALPTADQPAAEEAAEKKNPQEAGWVPKQSYDYDTYNKSGKEMLDESIALGGIQRSQWASDAARYEWNDEFGDVGPRFEDLEKELFGDEFRPRQGIDFSK
jgi:ATP-dependent RNA helicase DDX3X